MMRKFYLLLISLLLLGSLRAQVEPSGHWQNEQGVGANWSRWKNQIWFISINENWKEFFEGEWIGSDRIEGRLIKINLLNWQRYESRLEMKYSAKNEIIILTPSPPDSSYTSSSKLRYLGYYSAYENIRRPLFDEKHRAWEVKTWFQDGDSIATIFISNGDPVFDRGNFIGADSLQIIRKIIWSVHPCYPQEVIHCKLFPDGMIRVKARNLDSSCRNNIHYAWGGATYERYTFDGGFPFGNEKIDAREVAIPSDVLQLKINAIHIAGHPVRPDSGGIGHLLRMSERQEITFQFSTAISGLKLYHRLKGYDSGWHENRADYKMKYAHLPAGDYTFEVTTDPERLYVHGNTVEVHFRVFRPFFRQGWFYPVLAIAIGTFIFATFRWREQQRHSLDGLRQRIARELHDDIGSTLSSISLLTAAAKYRIQEPSTKIQLLNIGKKAQEALDNIGDILWAMRQKDVSGEELLQRMKAFALEILEACDIDVNFHLFGNVADFPLSVEQRKDFYLLFKEAVNNAAKYSNAEEVWISVKNINNKLHLEIRDNGRGFDPAAVQRGNGLTNMQRRAERLGGMLLIESATNAGTRIGFEMK